MRLTDEERQAIREAVAQVYGPTAVVRLFGSRVHDHLRGGDIDLHVEAQADAAGSEFKRKMRLASALEGPLDEGRVDLVVSVRGTPLTAIERVAYRDGQEV